MTKLSNTAADTRHQHNLRFRIAFGSCIENFTPSLLRHSWAPATGRNRRRCGSALCPSPRLPVKTNTSRPRWAVGGRTEHNITDDLLPSGRSAAAGRRTQHRPNAATGGLWCLSTHWGLSAPLQRPSASLGVPRLPPHRIQPRRPPGTTHTLSLSPVRRRVHSLRLPTGRCSPVVHPSVSCRLTEPAAPRSARLRSHAAPARATAEGARPLPRPLPSREGVQFIRDQKPLRPPPGRAVSVLPQRTVGNLCRPALASSAAGPAEHGARPPHRIPKQQTVTGAEAPGDAP